MNIYTPLAFFAFILSIYMGIYVIRINSGIATNRVFFGLAVSMAVWNLAYMFIYPDLDKSNAFFWYKISALGWCNFPAFVLHFFLLLAQKNSWFKKVHTWMLIYLPGLIFTWKALQGGFLANDFEPGPGKALFEIQNSDSLWYTIYVVYLWIFIISGVLAFAQYSRTTKSRKIKSQNKIFLIAVFILFSAISTTNLILPALGIKIIPAVGNIILIFWMFTVWYAIVKYKLMTFTVKSAANKLISKMKELLFFVDTEGRIIRVNSFTLSSLSFTGDELVNTDFLTHVDEHQKVSDILENIDKPDQFQDVTLSLIDSNNRLIPVSLSFSPIKDKTGDLLGTLIVGRDITLTLQLQKELAYRKEAELRIQQQNEALIQQKEELEAALVNLKNTQIQLIQAERMALLGELTAGITHEIQNPLNFVNNFSEVSKELIDELKKELEDGNPDEALYIAEDIRQNLEKINQHGKRADVIVKGMLQHSRSNTGIKEPADINALADEYLHLAYFGLRAKDKLFNVTLKTDYDPAIGKINVISQEIGRVIINLINNAFYTVTERKRMNQPGYEPIVTVSTKLIIPPEGGQRGAEIRVTDNGTGIPQNILDQIFQPFFTTKPAGQGTGLGLSLSYDIITNGHGGTLIAETKQGEGSVFIVILPIS